MVIWIIGKSGVGKTFLAKKIYYKIKKNFKKVIWVDGDKFRRKFSRDLGFSIKERRKNSLRIQKYCKSVKLSETNLQELNLTQIMSRYQSQNEI